MFEARLAQGVFASQAARLHERLGAGKQRISIPALACHALKLSGSCEPLAASYSWALSMVVA